MAKDCSFQMAFGDVKCGGRITADTNIGDTLALIKIASVSASAVHNEGQYKLLRATMFPQIYNVMHEGKDGCMNYFFLPDEVEVIFFSDF